MSPCFFIQLPDWDGLKCEVCHRCISSRTVREFNGRLLVVVCGVASEYDEPRARIDQTSQRFHWRDSPRENELIGQEGGRWDKFYLEGQS